MLKEISRKPVEITDYEIKAATELLNEVRLLLNIHHGNNNQQTHEDNSYAVFFYSLFHLIYKCCIDIYTIFFLIYLFTYTPS